MNLSILPIFPIFPTPVPLFHYLSIRLAPSRSSLRICSHLLKKCLMGNFIFCAVLNTSNLIFTPPTIFKMLKFSPHSKKWVESNCELNDESFLQKGKWNYYRNFLWMLQLLVISGKLVTMRTYHLQQRITKSFLTIKCFT